MADFRGRITNHAIVGIDTSIFIYQFENQPKYQPLTEILLQAVQMGFVTGIISTIVLMELTVHPWRQNRPDIARHYEAILAHFPHLEIVDITRDVARKAAQLRAKYNVRPADALNVAAAINKGATAYITNDRGLLRLHPELDIIILDEDVE